MAREFAANAGELDTDVVEVQSKSGAVVIRHTEGHKVL